MATTFLALFLMASPARPDDRQLLQANAGANTNVLLILDSSYSMNNDFSDTYRLPAFMDDFIYPEGVVPTDGSRFGVAKSVIRQVLTNTAGVNWAFAYFRNPNQTFGAAENSSGFGTLGQPVGGAQTAGEYLENGGLEWLYFADTLYPSNGSISGLFPSSEYPDVQQGRFLQMGHKVPHIYGTPGQPDLPPYTIPPANPDPRFPYPSPPDPGTWRGAFGPHGLNEGLVIYRSPSKPGYELRMTMIQGNYSDPFVVVQIDEYGPPAADTPTPTNTPTNTLTPTNTNTPTATRTPRPSRTATPSPLPTNSPTPTFTTRATNTPTYTPSNTRTATTTFTRTSTSTPSNTNTPSTTRTATNTSTATNTPSGTATRTPTATSTITNTPSNTPSSTVTNTPSRTATRTSTASNTPTSTASNTPSQTNTPSRTNTASATNTPSNTPTRTATRTATRTSTPSNTPSRTNTPSNTATRTSTNTPSRTNTPSNTPSRTATFTPSNTRTPTSTASRTNTPSSTNTPSRTNTPSNTATRTSTNTPSRTNTPSNTATQTNTPSNTPSRTATSTPSRTSTPSNTPSSTVTQTASRTATVTASQTRTPSRTPTGTSTQTATRTSTPSSTPTGTPPPTATFTPTTVPTEPGGAFPGKSLLPAIANWLAPAVRGLFAMAPPPPPASPCPGIPAAYTNGGQLVCAPCPYDANRLCAFVDTDGSGVIDPGEPAPSNLIPLPATPVFMRGFDDPQADPDYTRVLIQTAQIKYVRGDLYSLPPAYSSNDSTNGNPPWGSCPNPSLGCPASPDNDADAQPDTVGIADRHNQGMYSALYDKERIRQLQQYPNDAFGGPSCPLGIVGCDPFVQDCGGYAHFNSFKGFPATAPDGLLSPYVFPSNPPASPDDWPVVPFKREWLGTDYPGGNSPEDSIKRLLRFTSSIVSYDSSAPAERAYTLQEAAKEVAATASGTPIAGSLLDAYNYFVNSVFPGPTNGGAPDPAIDCRNYIIVLVTDGCDECGSDPCTGGITGNGPAGDLGEVLLPESAAGRRAAANALDPSVRIKGVPVFVVGLNTASTCIPTLTCVANNSGGQLFTATDRTQLQAALESILDFKRNANFFAAPSAPAFAGGVGDTAQIGAVVPSHLNTNGELSSWSIWSGTVKSFQLDSNGLIPIVTAAPATATPTETPGGPTSTPVVGTPTPTPIAGSYVYSDESDPDNANPAARKPVWSAGRVLGYTDPKADLVAGAAAAAAVPASRAPAISVWPGRKMIFARGAGSVPLTRANFLPNNGTCTGAGSPGSCFDDLMINMGLVPTSSVANQARAVLTVDFLRGGQTAFGSRDEILNNASIKPATILTAIGPAVGEENKYSYFYQDDAAAPGDPPQTRTDDDGTVPAGYAHKLGDIFHSEPYLVEPPRYYQYISANLAPRTSSTTFGEPYIDFANRHAKRRKVLLAGSNDGFLHGFDAGVWGRDTTSFPTAHDLGTGREIFAYTPRIVGAKFSNLLNFPPLPQYFVDGSMATADVFVDPAFVGPPDPAERAWRTVAVGGLRQGGEGYYALDVTQPDDIDLAVGPTLGVIVGSKDASPGCLDGGGTSCVAGALSGRAYPSILWEFTDAGAACSDGCATVGAPLGETWSRPVVGRIKVHDTASVTADGSGFDTRWVAIFGGGFDPSFTAGDRVSLRLPKGRALYMVDIETGQILYKTTEGGVPDGSGGFNAVSFAPMPAPPAVADYNDDGYLDVIYIGDVNGNMWRMDLTPDVANGVGEVTSGQLHGYQPFMLFNGCGSTADVICPNTQPIFYEPGIVYLGGAVNPPALGIAFGTGDRAELARPNTQTAAFYYVIDSGQTTTTFTSSPAGTLTTDLRNITPPGGLGPCPAPFDPASCVNAAGVAAPGFRLDFASPNEKTTSTVFSTLGYLSLVTFTPDSVSPCATNGSSYRYRFFFLTGEGYYGSSNTYGDFRETLGEGMAMPSQWISPQGDIVDQVLMSGGGGPPPQVTTSTQHTIEQNWKEQQ